MDSFDWGEDDYAVIDETQIGRIYKERVPGGVKWLWLQARVAAAMGPNQLSKAGRLERAPRAKWRRPKGHCGAFWLGICAVITGSDPMGAGG